MNPRQRLRLRVPPLELLSRTLLAIACLALVWYGAMAILLAIKVSPSTVETVSRYRTIYSYLANLRADDLTATVRLLLGLGGFAAFAALAFVVWQALPRPRLAREELQLPADALGTLVVEPRAIERAAEASALGHPDVGAASARYGVGEIALDLTVTGAAELPALLRDVRTHAEESLRRHELPPARLLVTVTDFKPRQRRELR
jgi:hypothetical protein